ncbi:MAG: hypothetical protein MUP85_12940 [Candidatus Lokiarchaeota archaeon]|nr:hypothetical protein [Candidatus Lokiarchaeota archaeon]
MPKGFVITKWTEDQGLIVYLNYPESIEVDLDDMMRIFYAHITGAGEAGNVMVRLEKARSNVSSYFTGMESESPLMINLILQLGEEPEMFGETVISDINDTILKYLSHINANPSQQYELTQELTSYLKNSLILLERLEHLSKEQRMAQIFTSEKGRAILELLREGPYTRTELRGILEDKINRIITNLEMSLDPFIKTDLVRQDWMEGDSDISLFLMSDFELMRAPAVKLVERAQNGFPTPTIAQKYLKEVKNFFITYKPSYDDNKLIAQNMVNPDKYDYIVLLREKSYPLSKIPKGPGESFETVRTFIDQLKEAKIITTIKDKDDEWVLLLTDTVADTFFPEYLIEKIRQGVSDKKLRKKTAIKHLEILEQVYKK